MATERKTPAVYRPGIIWQCGQPTTQENPGTGASPNQFAVVTRALTVRDRNQRRLSQPARNIYEAWRLVPTGALPDRREKTPGRGANSTLSTEGDGLGQPHQGRRIARMKSIETDGDDQKSLRELNPGDSIRILNDRGTCHKHTLQRSTSRMMSRRRRLWFNASWKS